MKKVLACLVGFVAGVGVGYALFADKFEDCDCGCDCDCGEDCRGCCDCDNDVDNMEDCFEDEEVAKDFDREEEHVPEGHEKRYVEIR